MMSQTSSSPDFGISSNIISLSEYLKLAQDHDLQIPVFQRQYEWNKESINLLFNDILDFSRSPADQYFIGQTITRLGPNNICEIVDGQQRTVSIFLWLRAIYQHLDEFNPTNTTAVKECQDKIASILWNQSDKDRNNWTPLISYTSLDKNLDDNHTSKRILKIILSPSSTQSIQKEEREHPFYANYECLHKLIKIEFPLDNSDPNDLVKFVDTLLNKVILQHTQVTSAPLSFKIFETLNARGLNLSSTDILKSKIYGSLQGEDQATFITAWQGLDQTYRELYGESDIQKLFNFYMRIVAAENKAKAKPEDEAPKSKSSTDVSNMLKFWEGENFARLTQPDLIPNLYKILDFEYLTAHDKIDWRKFKGFTNRKSLPSSEKWSNDTEIRQLLHVLSLTDQNWRISALCYWWFHHDKDSDFNENFKQYLHGLVAECCGLLILKESAYSDKKFLSINSNIVNSLAKYPLFKKSPTASLSLDKVKQGDAPYIYDQSSAKVLLTLLNYQKTNKLIFHTYEDESKPEGDVAIEVEHIVSRKWHNSYKLPELNEYIEHIGNKTLLNKSTNIEVSDKPVHIKIDSYQKLHDKLKITKEVADQLSEKTPEDPTNLIAFIKERDEEIITDLCGLLESWRIGKYATLKETK